MVQMEPSLLLTLKHSSRCGGTLSCEALVRVRLAARPSRARHGRWRVPSCGPPAARRRPTARARAHLRDIQPGPAAGAPRTARVPLIPAALPPRAPGRGRPLAPAQARRRRPAQPDAVGPHHDAQRQGARAPTVRQRPPAATARTRGCAHPAPRQPPRPLCVRHPTHTRARCQDYLIAEGGCDTARVYGTVVTYEPKLFFSQDGIRWGQRGAHSLPAPCTASPRPSSGRASS